MLPALVAGVSVTALVLVRPEYGLALTLALTPLTNLQVGGSKPFQLLLPVLACGLLLYGFLQNGFERVQHRNEVSGSRWLSASLVLFLAVGLASSMHALSPSASLKKIVILVAGTALFFAVRDIASDRRKLVVVAGGGLGGLFVAGLHGVAQHYLGFAGGPGFVVNGVLVHRVEGAFGHPNQYGGYLAFLIPLAAAIVFSRNFPVVARASAAAALAAGALGLVYSYARGAILGVVLGSIIWLAVLRPRIAMLAIIAVATLSAAFAPATLKERLNPQSASSDVPLRADIWQAALDIYATSPTLGVGVNNFGTAYQSLPSTLPNARQRRLLDQNQFIVPPHAQNLYLNVLAEEGIIGIAALAALLAAALVTFYRCSRLQDPVGRAIGLGCGAGFMAMLLHGLLEQTLFTEMTLPFYALLALATRAVWLERERISAGSA
jgi:O-antigen ligase